MKLASRYLLIYDPIYSAFGGGEKVLISIVKALAPVDIFIPIFGDNPSTRSLIKKIKKINTNNKISYFKKTGSPLLFKIYRFIFLLFSDYLLGRVSQDYKKIFVYTSFDMFGFKKSEGSRKIVYINTPNYFLWKINTYDTFLKRLVPSVVWEKFFSIPLRNRSIAGLNDADVVLCISKEVSTRIYTYFNKDAGVLYVPNYVNPTNRELKLEKFLETKFKKQFFLIVSRVLKYKNIQYLIRVYNNFNIMTPLFIVGTGPYLSNLKNLAKNQDRNKEQLVKIGKYYVTKIGNIYFWNYVSNMVVNSLYIKALATFSLNNEDWGLSKIESLYWKTPIIAYKIGSNLELLRDGINGVFFENLKAKIIKKAIDRFFEIYKTQGFNVDLNKSKFTEEVFINKLKNII